MGCKNIHKGKTCYTASNPDGDRLAAINVFHDTLNVLNHTRNDFPERADIIELVVYIKQIYFVHAINWICEICGYSYYDSPYKKEIETDPCLAVLKDLEPKNSEEDVPMLLLDDKALLEYVQCPNIWFKNEGISHYVQNMFEVGFSLRDECITIPIRDEMGNLVGVKGRTVSESKSVHSKYWFPYPVPKTKILYGLDKAYSYIKEEGKVLVFESEKSVQKAFSMGFCNSVSIGGHEISDTQVLKLEKLGVDIVFLLDKDISGRDVKKQASKFLVRDRLYAVLPIIHKDLLQEKDSPVDRGIDTFIRLYTEDIYKIPA